MRLVLPAITSMLVATIAFHADEPKPARTSKPVPPKAADGDAPLPEGWPAATKPAAVEIKQYPAYRSAVARAKDVANSADSADTVLFFALFGHISRNKVEMTAPVVNTYAPAMVEDPKAKGPMTMEFLYRTPDQGKTGRGLGAVVVEDHPASTYACRGVQGPMTAERLRDEMAALRGWLDEHKAEWVADGPPRRLGYHGPMTPEAERLWEVQIPVKPARKPGADHASSAPPSPG